MAQTSPSKDSYYISEINPTEDEDVLELTITHEDEKSGVGYYDFVQDKFIDEIDVIKPTEVAPEEFGSGFIITQEQNVDIIRDGSESEFRLLTENGGVWQTFDDNGILSDIDISNLEATGFRNNDYTGVVMSAYDTNTGISHLFLFSYYGQSLRKYTTFDFQVNLSSIIHYEKLDLLEVPIPNSDDLRYFWYDVSNIRFIHSTESTHDVLLNALDNTISSVQTPQNDTTQSQLNVTAIYQEPIQYSRTFDSAELSEFESTDEGFLNTNHVLMLMFTSLALVTIIRKKTQAEF